MVTEASLSGPRPSTNRPKISAPPGACDCHTHIVGPAARYPLTPDRSYTPNDASPDDILRMLGAIGFDRVIVVQGSFHGADNRRVVDAVAELGQDRARGVAMVPADVDHGTLRRLNDAGIRGARFITVVRGGASLDQLRDVARKVAPFGWHVEMFVPPQVLPDLLPVVADLPVPVVFGHFGGIAADCDPDDPRLAPLLRLMESGKCWVKLTGYRFSRTGHPFGDLKPRARLFVETAPDRCLWGSDWPFTNVTDYVPDAGDLFDLFCDWVPDAAERKKILVDNPATLYGFEA